MARGQLTPTSDGRITHLHWAVRVAFALDLRPAAPAYRACNSSAQHKVIVGCIDYRVDLLLDEISVDDDYARRRQASISLTQASSCPRSARAIPLTPTSAIVKEAHATPQTRAS